MSVTMIRRRIRMLCNLRAGRAIAPTLMLELRQLIPFDAASIVWDDGGLYVTEQDESAGGGAACIDHWVDGLRGVRVRLIRETAFTQDEGEILRSLNSYFVAGLGPAAKPVEYLPIGNPSAAIVDARGAIKTMPRETAGLLGMAFGTAPSAPRIHKSLMTAGGATFTSEWGRFVLTAHRLTDAVDGPWTVLVQRHVGVALATYDALRNSGLTEQQWTAAIHLVEGDSTPEIAANMGISRSTANYHVRKLFKKLGVHCRRDILSIVGVPA